MSTSTIAGSLSYSDGTQEPVRVLDRFGFGSDTAYKTTTRRTYLDKGHGQGVIRATVEDLITGETTTRDYLANLVTAPEATLDLLSLVTTGQSTLSEVHA